MKKVTALQDETESWRLFDVQLHDLLELAEMDDASILGELESEIDALEKDLEKPPMIRGAKNIEYNKQTGEIKYIQMQPPKILGMIEKMHKATSSTPLYFLNVFFGIALLFFVFSAYWMFLPQTEIFKKAIYFTLGGILLSLLMILI